MLATIESRIARLEAKQPRPVPNVRLLGRRAPYSWLPRGVTRLTPKQSAIFLSPARFRVVVAGRRSGKTYLSVCELSRAARSGTGQLVWYVAPSYRQAKTVLWAALKSAIPPQWIASKNETDLSITLRGYNSIIALRSADSPDSLRGAGLNFVVLYEFSNIDPVTWGEVIWPALADKRGAALIMGSPRGFNHFYDLYTQAHETDDWEGFKFSTAEGGLVAPEEIDAVQASLDPTTYAQEFLADFTQSTNRVYLMFERSQNVRADLVDPGADLPPLPAAVRDDTVAREAHARRQRELWCGIDFNVNPMSAVIAVKAADELHVLDELTLHNANTEQLAEALKLKYPGRRILCYPDPTGRARKTSAAAGITDFVLLERAGFPVVAPNAPYAVVDKINCVNALLCDVQGRRRLFIHPRCKKLIEALEQHAYKEGTSFPDKSHGFDHLTDALAYVVAMEFPIQQQVGRIKLIGV